MDLTVLRGRLSSALGRRRSPGDNELGGSRPLPPEAAERHRVMIERLLATAHTPLSPYQVKHLAAHAGAAGLAGWQALAAQPAVLDRLDPDTVASAALRTAFARYPLPAAVAAMMTERDALRRSAVGDRPGVRQVAMARHTGAVRPAGQEPDGDWGVRWARLRHEPPHYTLDPPREEYPGSVTSLCALPMSDDRCLIACGTSKGTVRLADTYGGAIWGKQLSLGNNTEVTALSPFRLPDGATVLAVGDSKGMIRLWDPDAGQPRGLPFTVTAPVRALCEFRAEGANALLVSGGNDGRIDTWNPVTGQLASRIDASRYTGGVISALSVLTGQQDRILLAAGGDKRMVILDPFERKVVSRQDHRFTGSVNAVAVAVPEPGRSLVAWGTTRSGLGVWDSASGQGGREWALGGVSEIVTLSAATAADGQARLVIGGTGAEYLASPAALAFTAVSQDLANDDLDDFPFPVLQFEPTKYYDRPTASCVARLPGRPDLVAIGTEKGAVVLWDPGAANPVPLASGHTKRVHSVQVIPRPGRPEGSGVLLSGAEDSTIGCWDLENGEPAADALDVGYTVGAFGALAVDGVGTLVACAAKSSVVRLYRVGDDDSGGFALAEWGQVPTTHRAVNALCDVSASGAGPLLATGGDEGAVQLWDPRTQEAWGEELDLGAQVDALCRIPVTGGGDLLAIGTNRRANAVLLWDPETGAVRHLADTPPWVSAVCAVPQPGGRTLLAGGSKDGNLALWDPVTGTRVASADKPGGTMWAICALHSATGRTLIASAGESYRVRLWHAATFELVRELDIRTPTFGMTAVGADLALATHTGVLVLRLSEDLFPPAAAAPEPY